jgi:putative ABC transport system permease protein
VITPSPFFSSSDFRRSFRSLLRNPSFTAAAVLTLALGLGATTAIFGVMYGVLLKPLPYPDPHELVSLRHTAPGLSAAIGGAADDSLGLADSMYVTYREENRVFEHVGRGTAGSKR